MIVNIQNVNNDDISSNAIVLNSISTPFHTSKLISKSTVSSKSIQDQQKLTTTNVTIEILPRLKSVNFLVSTINPSSVKLNEATIAIDQCIILLPVTLKQTSRWSQSEEGIDIVANISDKNHLEYKSIIPYSAASLILCCKITCHRCQADLFAESVQQDVAGKILQPFRRVLDLPSTYWHEVVDCWMCHMEDYGKMITPNGWLHPKSKRDLLVGSTFVVLHHQDIRMDSITIDKPKKETWRFKSTHWLNFKCRICSSPLGQATGFDIYNNCAEKENDEKKVATSFKLYKYAVDFWLKPSSSEQYFPFPIYLAHELLETASSNASYRYLIWSYDDNQKETTLFMLILLLNSGVRVGSIEVSSPHDKKNDLKLHCRPTLKVLYMDCSGSLDPVSTKIKSTWLSSKGTERFTYPIPQCTELLASLSESATRYVPKSKRMLNGMNVGYLFLGI